MIRWKCDVVPHRPRRDYCGEAQDEHGGLLLPPLHAQPVRQESHREKQEGDEPRNHLGKRGKPPGGAGKSRSERGRHADTLHREPRGEGGEQQERRFLKDEGHARNQERVQRQPERAGNRPREGRGDLEEQKERRQDPRRVDQRLEDRRRYRGGGFRETVPATEEKREQRRSVHRRGRAVRRESFPLCNIPGEREVLDGVVLHFGKRVRADEQQRGGERHHEEDNGMATPVRFSSFTPLSRPPRPRGGAGAPSRVPPPRAGNGDGQSGRELPRQAPEGRGVPRMRHEHAGQDRRQAGQRRRRHGTGRRNLRCDDHMTPAAIRAKLAQTATAAPIAPYRETRRDGQPDIHDRARGPPPHGGTKVLPEHEAGVCEARDTVEEHPPREPRHVDAPPVKPRVGEEVGWRHRRRPRRPPTPPSTRPRAFPTSGRSRRARPLRAASYDRDISGNQAYVIALFRRIPHLGPFPPRRSRRPPSPGLPRHR